MTSQGRPAALEEYYARTVKNHETSMLRAKACQPSRWHPRATWLSTGKIYEDLCILGRVQYIYSK